MKIEYFWSPLIGNEELNRLFGLAWEGHRYRDFSPVLERSLGYICALYAQALVGFVNLAWDGGAHAFLLDTTVHPDFRRRGIGKQLVMEALELARSRGLEWVHVDYEPQLEAFYQGCGFEPTLAGLVRLETLKSS